VRYSKYADDARSLKKTLQNKARSFSVRTSVQFQYEDCAAVTKVAEPVQKPFLAGEL